MLLLLALACHADQPGDTGPDTDAGTGPDTDAETSPDTADTADTGPLPWADCGDGTECAEVEVPLAGGEQERISLHLRRLLPPEPATRAL